MGRSGELWGDPDEFRGYCVGVQRAAEGAERRASPQWQPNGSMIDQPVRCPRLGLSRRPFLRSTD